jgi:hypothetical protein
LKFYSTNAVLTNTALTQKNNCYLTIDFRIKKTVMRKFPFYLFISLAVNAQEKTVTGTILSVADNSKLPGASVRVKGTNKSTQTDANGVFTIKASKGDVLIITHVGYNQYSVTVGDGATVSVKMTATDAQLGEVVVTAMGIKKERKALGYSVSELNAQELMKNKNTNIVNSLAGKVPGVNVTQSSGSAGAGASITIRGGNSTSDGRFRERFLSR